MKKMIIALSIVVSFALTATAGCVQWTTTSVSCGLCGGDGLEDSGTRIGRPQSEWKNKHKCRQCSGSGRVQQKKCIKWEDSKPSRATAN